MTNLISRITELAGPQVTAQIRAEFGDTSNYIPKPCLNTLDNLIQIRTALGDATIALGDLVMQLQAEQASKPNQEAAALRLAREALREEPLEPQSPREKGRAERQYILQENRSLRSASKTQQPQEPFWLERLSKTGRAMREIEDGLLAAYDGCNSEEMAVMLGLTKATVLQMINAAEHRRDGK